MAESGHLFVCATPIGNLEDISARLRRTLADVDVVYAEDTRRTRALLAHLGIGTPLRSLFVGNEKTRTKELVDAVSGGKNVALVSDAGMPTVSDPGAEAVTAVRSLGHPVVVIPGPSAVTAAVALAGFGADRFAFEGFLPRKGKARAERIGILGSDDRATVLFASPNRLLGDLSDLLEALGGERQIAITRELTKLHEEVWTGTLGESVAEWGGRQPRGEFTLVVAPGAPRKVSMEDAVGEARNLIEDGVSPSEAARQVAAATGVSRRGIYEAVIDHD